MHAETEAVLDCNSILAYLIPVQLFALLLMTLHDQRFRAKNHRKSG